MKFIDQTEFGETGNCFQACLATLLNLDIEKIPHFAKLYDDGNWFGEVNKWLCQYGLNLMCFHYEKDASYLKGCYHLLSGQSSRGLTHAVVGYEGKIIHDPHPDRGGLQTIEHSEVFVKLNPRTSVHEKEMINFLIEKAAFRNGHPVVEATANGAQAILDKIYIVHNPCRK